jgi:hypothetical protein
LRSLTDDEIVSYLTKSRSIGEFLASKGHTFSALTEEMLARHLQEELERRKEHRGGSWQAFLRPKVLGPVAIAATLAIAVALYNHNTSSRKAERLPTLAPKDAVLGAAIPHEEATERAIVLMDLGYDIYQSSVVLATKPPGFDPSTLADASHAQMSGLYSRLGLTMPSRREIDREYIDETEAMLPTERDRSCLRIGMDLAVIKSIGFVVIAHRGTRYETEGREHLAADIPDLRQKLESLGILRDVEQSGNVDSYVQTKDSDTEDLYDRRIDDLKAAIVGAYRHTYAGRG